MKIPKVIKENVWIDFIRGFNIQVWRFNFNIGWNPGENFVLFGVKIFEGNEVVMIFFEVTITYFSIGFHYSEV